MTGQPASLLRGLNTTSTIARSSFSERACAPCGPYTAAMTEVPSCDQCADPSARWSTPRTQLMLLQEASLHLSLGHVGLYAAQVTIAVVV